MLTIRRRLSFSTQSDLEVLRQQLNLQANLAENHALTNPGLAIGSSSKADVLVANTVEYVRAGRRRADKTTAEVNITADATMADDGTVRSVGVLVVINGSDAFATVAGPVVSNGGSAVLPDVPVGSVLLGYVTISAAAGTSYTPDSTLLDAAGITATFVSDIRPTWKIARLLDVNGREV